MIPWQFKEDLELIWKFAGDNPFHVRTGWLHHSIQMYLHRGIVIKLDEKIPHCYTSMWKLSPEAVRYCKRNFGSAPHDVKKKVHQDIQIAQQRAKDKLRDRRKVIV